MKPAPADVEMWGLRRQYLTRQLASLRSRVAMLQGKRLTFDEESLALYDAVAPTKPVSEFEAVLKQLEARLPGNGTLIDRYDRFKQAFVIPTARVDRVFQEAIRGCRGRVPSLEPAAEGAVHGRVRHQQVVERATTGIRATSGA